MKNKCDLGRIEDLLDQLALVGVGARRLNTCGRVVGLLDRGARKQAILARDALAWPGRELAHRERLTRERALVDNDVARQDQRVDCDGATGLEAQHVAGDKVGGGNDAVLLIAPYRAGVNVLGHGLDAALGAESYNHLDERGEEDDARVGDADLPIREVKVTPQDHDLVHVEEACQST